MSSTEIKTANAENSKNIITAEVNDTCQVRVYSKSRAKGEMKYKKRRDTFTFKTTEAANTAINTMVDSGTKIRKVEVIGAAGTVESFKPQRVRLTPTREQKDAAKAERLAKREIAKATKARLKEEARTIKASAKAAVKDNKVEVVESAAAPKTKVAATAKPKAIKVTPNVAEKALS